MLTPYLQLKVNPAAAPEVQTNLEAIDAAFGSLLTVYTATLVAGAVTIANGTVATTSLSRIVFARSTAGGTIGTVSCVLTPGTSIVFNSSSASDTSTISYQVVNSPASFVLGVEPSFVADPSSDNQTVPAQIKNY